MKVRTFKPHWVFYWIGAIISDLFSKKSKPKKDQRLLRKEMLETVRVVAELAVRNGGFDPAARAIRIGDVQRKDFVGRMKEIADNEPFWISVPEKNWVPVGGLRRSRHFVERDTYRDRLLRQLQQHDQLEKRRSI